MYFLTTAHDSNLDVPLYDLNCGVPYHDDDAHRSAMILDNGIPCHSRLHDESPFKFEDYIPSTDGGIIQTGKFGEPTPMDLLYDSPQSQFSLSSESDICRLYADSPGSHAYSGCPDSPQSHPHAQLNTPPQSQASPESQGALESHLSLGYQSSLDCQSSAKYDAPPPYHSSPRRYYFPKYHRFTRRCVSPSIHLPPTPMASKKHAPPRKLTLWRRVKARIQNWCSHHKPASKDSNWDTGSDFDLKEIEIKPWRDGPIEPYVPVYSQ